MKKFGKKKEDTEALQQDQVRKVIESIMKKDQFADNGIPEDVLKKRLKDYYYKREARQIRRELKQNDIQYENTSSSRNRLRPRYRKVDRLNEQQIKRADEIANNNVNEILEGIRFHNLQNDFDIDLSGVGQRLYKLKKKARA